MFNPLNLFKKKPVEPTESAQASEGSVADKPVQIDHIAIHTMPERFRQTPTGTSSAKRTGALIIGGGVIILAAASAGLYYYFFRTPAVTVKVEEPAVTENQPAVNQPVNKPPLNTASSTEAEATTTPEIPPVDTTIATSTATSTPEVVEPKLPTGLVPSLDSDLDGLSDAEEILLGSSTSTPDTDGDGYLDGAEVKNLYDPTASSSKLIDNREIALYENKTYGYSLLYPRPWQTSDNGGDDSVMFKSDDNQFFQVIVQANTAKQTLDQWYMDQLDVTTINDADRVSGTNWQGIKNIDGLTVYLMDAGQKNIFTLAYNPGENNILDYINLFGMMIKSFTLK